MTKGNNKPNSVSQIWSITSPELGVTVDGQFPIEEINMGTVGGMFSDISSINMAHPITQWIRGTLESFTFETMFWFGGIEEGDKGYKVLNKTAKTPEDEIKSTLDLFLEDRYNTLLTLAQRDENLNRTPICIFTYGKIKLKCFVQSVSNIRTGFLNPDGTLREIKFTLTLRKYVESAHTSTEPGAPTKNTFYHQVKTGETYESISKKHYKQPIYGEIVRRFQGYKPDLTEGDIVIVPKLEYVLKRRKIQPQSSILSENDESKDRLNDLFEDRSEKIIVVGE